MSARTNLSTKNITIAKIIFAEFYYSVHGYPCDVEIWIASFDAWKAGSPNMPMVDAAVAAAEAIETGTVRFATPH